MTRTKLAGYQVCIIRLERGTKIQTTYLEIRADMFSCHNATITRLGISLTDPLKLLLTKLPAIDNLPHMATIAQARQQFIKGIQLKISEVPEYQRFSFDKLDELAKRYYVISRQFIPVEVINLHKIIHRKCQSLLE